MVLEVQAAAASDHTQIPELPMYEVGVAIEETAADTSADWLRVQDTLGRPVLHDVRSAFALCVGARSAGVLARASSI